MEHALEHAKAALFYCPEDDCEFAGAMDCQTLEHHFCQNHAKKNLQPLPAEKKLGTEFINKAIVGCFQSQILHKLRRDTVVSDEGEDVDLDAIVYHSDSNSNSQKFIQLKSNVACLFVKCLLNFEM